MTNAAPRALPLGVLLSVFAGGARGCVAIVSENGNRILNIHGFGQTSEQAKADATERYYAEAFDHRTEAAHIKGTVWLRDTAGRKVRMPASEEAELLAQGYTKGRGPNAPKAVEAAAQ